jgi:Predicted membrane protein (DUF2231)
MLNFLPGALVGVDITNSMSPAAAANAPITRPAPMSHTDALDQNGFAVPHKARSVARAPTRKATGRAPTVLILALINLMLRIGDPEEAVLPVGLVLSLITVGLLLVTGWMGGELAYRYKIGVIEEVHAVKHSAISLESRALPTEKRT